MAISIDWGSKVISVPRADMTLIQASPEIRELDMDVFRLALKDLEDSDEGMPFPDTHRHNTEVVLSGVTYSRFIEIINGYTVTFEDGQYAVQAVGANSNLADVMNVNQVSLRTANSAGLVTVDSGAGDWTATEKAQIRHRLGVDGSASAPVADPSLVDKIMASAVEGGYDLRDTMALMAAALLGKVSGAGTTSIDIKGIDGTTTRISATVDANGNRSVVVLTP